MKKLHRRSVRFTETCNRDLNKFHNEIKKRSGDISFSNIIRALWVINTHNPQHYQHLLERVQYYLNYGVIKEIGPQKNRNKPKRKK